MTDAAIPAPPKEVGAVARIPGVIFSPVPTFESIARRPTFVAPLVLWTAASLLVTALLLPRIDFDRMIRASLERRGQTLPEERITSIVESQRRVAPVLYNVIAAVTPTLIALVVAVVFWGAFKAFGWDLSFQQSLGATVHAFVPAVVGSILFIPVLLRQETLDPSTMGDLFLSNLGFLVGRRTSPVIHSLLQSIDLFSLWCLALLVVGFSAAARVSRAKAASLIVSIWAVYVLGKAGFAALFR